MRIDELRELLDEFERECFELRVEASETRARDEVVSKSYECIRDKFAECIQNSAGGRTSEYVVDFGTNNDSFVRIAIAKQHGVKLRKKIVRCLDCKHYDPDNEPSEVYSDRYWCDKLTVYMPTDGFCSFGE